MKKEIYFTATTKEILLWETGSEQNEWMAHINHDRKLTINHEFHPDNLKAIKRFAKKGNCILWAGSDTYLALKPLNEPKYIQYDPETKQETKFSIEIVDDVKYKCFGNRAYKVNLHPCKRNKQLFYDGGSENINIYISYDPKYLVYTHGEWFIKKEYQFVPKPSEKNQICNDILSKSIPLNKIDFKQDEWYPIPGTNDIGHYRGKHYGDIVFITPKGQEYRVNVTTMLEVVDK